jgi:hypothetical protein
MTVSTAVVANAHPITTGTRPRSAYATSAPTIATAVSQIASWTMSPPATHRASDAGSNSRSLRPIRMPSTMIAQPTTVAIQNVGPPSWSVIAFAVGAGPSGAPGVGGWSARSWSVSSIIARSPG